MLSIQQTKETKENIKIVDYIARGVLCSQGVKRLDAKVIFNNFLGLLFHEKHIIAFNM